VVLSDSQKQPEAVGEHPDHHFRTDDLKANLALRAARGGVVTVVSQGLKFFVGMGATIVLARLLTPQDYGLVGMVGVIAGFISIFKDLGLASATIQKAEVNEAQINTLFWVNIVFSTAIMILTAALAPLVARFYGEPRLVWITVAYAAGFLLSGLTVQHEALLKRRMRFTALALTEIFSLLVAISVAIVLALYGATYWALVFSHLSRGVAYALSVWIACGWRPGAPSINSGVRSMLAFGGNLTGFSVINYFARNLDNLLIARFWGSEQLGLYERAYQVLLFPIDQMNAPIAYVAVPALSRMVDSPDRYRLAYLRILEKVAILTMPLMAFLIATADWMVLLVLGPKWTGAGRIVAFLGIAGFAQPICNTAGWLYMTQGRTHHMFQWGLIGGTISIIAIVAGLPWGGVGVAASYSLTYVCVVAPMVFWFVGREGPVRARDVYRTVAPFFWASTATLLALLWFRRWTRIERPVIGIVVCLAIATGLTLLVLAVIPAGRRALKDLGHTTVSVIQGTGI
jgi:O-antigen/teichoic acid export membrane protein